MKAAQSTAHICAPAPEEGVPYKWLGSFRFAFNTKRGFEIPCSEAPDPLPYTFDGIWHEPCHALNNEKSEGMAGNRQEETGGVGGAFVATSIWDDFAMGRGVVMTKITFWNDGMMMKCLLRFLSKNIHLIWWIGSNFPTHNPRLRGTHTRSTTTCMPQGSPLGRITGIHTRLCPDLWCVLVGTGDLTLWKPTIQTAAEISKHRQ